MLPVYRANGTLYNPLTGAVQMMDPLTGQQIASTPPVPPGAPPPPPPAPPPPGQAFVTDPSGQPLVTPEGQFLTAVAPKGADGKPLGGSMPTVPLAGLAPNQQMYAEGMPEDVYDPGDGMGYGGYEAGGMWSDSFGDGSGAPVDMGGDYPRYTGDTAAPHYLGGGLHPFFGGAMPDYGSGDGGGGPRPLPQLPRNNAYLPGGGGYSSGGGGGDGGDFARQMAGKLKGKMLGYGSDGYGDYPESDPYDPYADEKMRGAAKGMSPEQAASLFYRPQMMIPRVDEGIEATGANYGLVNELPATELAYLLGGRKKGWDGGPNDLANGIHDAYDTALNGKDWFDWDELSGNLARAKGKNNGLANLFSPHEEKDSYGNPYEVNPTAGDAAYAYQGMLNAAIDTTLPPIAAAGYAGYGDWLINQWGSKALGKDPAKAPPINRWVGKRLER